MGKMTEGNMMNEFCLCEKCSSVTARIVDCGYWDVCCDCGKPLEDGFHPNDEEADIDE